MQKKLYRNNPDYTDANYWQRQGWLGKARPWNKQKWNPCVQSSLTARPKQKITLLYLYFLHWTDSLKACLPKKRFTNKTNRFARQNFSEKYSQSFVFFFGICYNIKVRGCGSAGRAMRSQRIGRGFESHHLHHAPPIRRRFFLRGLSPARWRVLSYAQIRYSVVSLLWVPTSLPSRHTQKRHARLRCMCLLI